MTESERRADELAERSKYERMWAIGGYRGASPGQRVYKDFIARTAIGDGDTLIDFGCGTGRAALDIRNETGAHVLMLDITASSLDPEVRAALCEGFRFEPACLWALPPVRAKYGFCTDVMEHLPPARVDEALACIMASVEHCYFQIYTEEDAWGAQIGETLHLTCRPFDWWRAKLSEFGKVAYEQNNGITVIFGVDR